MKILRLLKLCLLLLLTGRTVLSAQTKHDFDVVVYGGTSAGVIAAYTAKQMGKSVLLIEPGTRIGGLTTGGLGYTDIGNKYAINGLSLDFYRKVGQHYGNFEQWIFEPHVAEDIFWSYLKRADVQVLFRYRIISAEKSGTKIRSITVEYASNPGKSTNKIISGKQFIDCSYEGDLLARSGVSYTVGREDNKQYNETYNGSQFREKHQFPDSISPYKIPGKPESGLVWGISNQKLLPDGTGNKMVQTYNIRVCLTKNPANRIPITRPDDYKPERYELLLRLIKRKSLKNIRDFMTTSEMPNEKTDINNNGAFSTDMIGMSWTYPEANYKERTAIFKAHENYTKGLFYFAGHDTRVPLNIRRQMLEYGYPKDEYLTTNHFTTQMYVREARRMVGEYVMTQANCLGKEVVNDGVGMAAYTMDSHNAERIVVNGMVKNEGDVQIGGFGPYPISYRSLIPKAAECSNLLVPVCLSASHIAYGSIRMEPVFMMLAQSAAVAACTAIDENKDLQQVDVRKIQSVLKENPLADGSTPEVLTDDNDTASVVSNGRWKIKKGLEGSYGPSAYETDSLANATDFVKFTPDIKIEGAYGVFFYISKDTQLSSTINLRVHDATGDNEVNIDLHKINVKGQTSGEWVEVGVYHFSRGRNGSLTVTGKNSNGKIRADAALFVPVRD